jgi:hypothetical protein
MRAKAPGRLQAAGLCCVALRSVLGASRTAFAASEYVLDVTGTIEVTGEAARPASGNRIVQYWVIFQYREPGVEGASFQDRIAQVTDGAFEVEGLLRNKVYRVIVQRVTIDASLPGGGSRENIPLNVPLDFWKSVQVGPGTPFPAPVVFDLAIVAPSSNERGRSLSFQYNGEQVRLAAYTADEGVI